MSCDRAYRDEPPPSAPRTVEDHVLLVDPDSALLDALQRCFESDGYRVTVASDGLEAVRKLGDMPSLPVAIIAAEELPSMSGSELDQFVRSDPSLGSIVVIVTAECTETELESIVVQRPARYDVLCRIIRQLRDTIRPPSSRRVPHAAR